MLVITAVPLSMRKILHRIRCKITQLVCTHAKKSNVAMQQVGQAANSISEGAGKVASATAPVTAGVLGLGAAVLATVPATEEYRVAQGKLNTAYEAAGYSADTAATAYNEFYKILGDTDTATEASQLLAKLVTNEEDVTSWTKIAAGVFGTFGDSLPIEGLIEASNETAKVGTVTGVLADALNWAGISEDEFNTKLAACGTEAERNKLIMDTLSGTYSGAADSFYENNAALMESREASAAMQEAMAELATSIAPVVTMATQLAATFLNWFNSLSSGQKVAIAAILAIVAAISPVATVIGTVSSAIAIFTGAATPGTAAATGLATVMTVLTGPVGLVIAAVAAAAAAIILLWNNCEGFRTAVTTAWEVIKQAFQAEHGHTHTQTKAVINRLSRAIGHLESVKRMVESGRDCTEVLVQLAAVRSALNSTAKVILKDHLEHCVHGAGTGETQQLAALNEAIDKFMS